MDLDFQRSTHARRRSQASCRLKSPALDANRTKRNRSPTHKLSNSRPQKKSRRNLQSLDCLSRRVSEKDIDNRRIDDDVLQSPIKSSQISAESELPTSSYSSKFRRKMGRMFDLYASDESSVDDRKKEGLETHSTTALPSNSKNRSDESFSPALSEDIDDDEEPPVRRSRKLKSRKPRNAQHSKKISPFVDFEAESDGENSMGDEQYKTDDSSDLKDFIVQDGESGDEENEENEENKEDEEDEEDEENKEDEEDEENKEDEEDEEDEENKENKEDEENEENEENHCLIRDESLPVLKPPEKCQNVRKNVDVSRNMLDFDVDNGLLGDTMRKQDVAVEKYLRQNVKAQLKWQRKQQKSLGRRLEQLSDPEVGSEDEADMMENLWNRMFNPYLSEGNEQFFNSDKARMASTPTRKSQPGGRSIKDSYRGMNINEMNCADVQKVKMTEFNHLWRRPSTIVDKQWEQFLCTVGQLARCAIANQIGVGEIMYQPGQLFMIASKKLLFKVFIRHFEIGGTDSTAMNKSRQCLKFSRAALDHFRQFQAFGKDGLRNGLHERDISESIQFLKEKAAENKRGSRYEASLARVKSTRIEAGRHLTEQDFESFRSISTEALRGIIDSYNRRARRQCPRSFQEQMKVIAEVFADGRVLMKWGINFTACLMWYGNGQRTQVYTFLKVPTEDVLEAYAKGIEEGNHNQPFEILIDEREKRQRSVYLNAVLLSPEVFQFVEFHSRFVLPYLHERHKIPSGDNRRRFLLLHTATGAVLNTNSVRSTLSKFCNAIDSNLHVTPSMLRAAYASFMVHKHVNAAKSGESDTTQNPETFIATLAKVMNTSESQIKEVYATAISAEYSKSVSIMLGIVQADEKSV